MVLTRRRDARADARRGLILAAAAGVFRKRGVAGAGMREIAEAAGLSLGNLYYYFKNKDELVYYCQAQALDRMLAAAVSFERGSMPASARLRHVIMAHMACTLDEIEGGAAHTDIQALPADLRRRIVARRDRYEKAVRRIVSDGISRREFRRVDPVLVTRAMLGALNSAVQWFRKDGPEPATAVAAAFADYLVQGLMK